MKQGALSANRNAPILNESYWLNIKTTKLCHWNNGGKPTKAAAFFVKRRVWSKDAVYYRHMQRSGKPSDNAAPPSG